MSVFSKISVFLLICSVNSMGMAQTLQITYFPAPESKNDTRFDYATELLKKALEKTETSDGQFKMKPSGKMNVGRAFQFLEEGKIVNVGWSTPTKEREKRFIPILIPINKGLLGYRIFLINKQDRKKFAAINTLEELKELKVGQGHVWNDVKVFKANDFKVVTGPDYEGLFEMLSAERFDYFSRGINEAPKEHEERKGKLPSLFIEESILLYYPWPKYFFTSKKTPKLAARIERGLRMMIQDGSFDKHFMKYHQRDIERVNLQNRKLFRIHNPLLLPSAPIDHKELWFDPFDKR
ncbi:MAG: amino acid ABC transporter substrate-binding protein [Bermanella sp.]